MTFLSRRFSKVGQSVLRMTFAKALPTLDRVSIALIFAEVAMPRGGDVDALEGGVSSQRTGRGSVI